MNFVYFHILKHGKPNINIENMQGLYKNSKFENNKEALVDTKWQIAFVMLF